MQYGEFDSQRQEYHITRPDTPRPWTNYLGSKTFGAVISNHGTGYSFLHSAAQGKLTRFRFNAVPADYNGKFIYIKDRDDGEFWSNSWLPVKKDPGLFKGECRHGLGYTIISSEYRNISCECLHFIPLGEPVELCRVKVKNNDSKPRNISMYPFIEVQTNWNAEDDVKNLQYTQYIASVTYNKALDMLDKANNKNMPEDPGHFENKDQERHLFFGVNGIKSEAFEGDLERFFGPYGNAAAPDALGFERLDCTQPGGDMPCFAFQFDLGLGPDEEKVFTLLFGPGKAAAEGKRYKDKYKNDATVLSAKDEVRKYWSSRLSVLKVEMADKDVENMINTWSPYNNLMTFYWSRAASLVYAGERDGLGYRDTAQDIIGASALIPEEAGARLELLISGQCSTGGAMPVVKPFSHTPGKERPPEAYRADDCLWLFNAIPEWVKETGQIDFYKKVIPYADTGQATVFEHMKRAIEFNLERTGNHGLPCGLEADWNDCLRLGETGESVFVAFQLRLALVVYTQVAEMLNDENEKKWAVKQLEEFDELLKKHTWDGKWYLRAYRYDGLKFGSSENPEGSIFMNAQAWAVLSGHAQKDRAEKAIESMDKMLSTEYGVMVCTPPYVETDPQIALARLMEPGMKENGGVFNHTQGWAMMAAAALGQNERAWKYLKHVLPSSFNDKAEIRQVEPYAVCQSTHSSFSPRYGSGRVPWLSGSAVWNYVAMSYSLLGIKPDYYGLEISPCLPKSVPEVKIQRQFRGVFFRIHIKNTGAGKTIVHCNGSRMDKPFIPVEAFEQQNTVEVEC